MGVAYFAHVKNVPNVAKYSLLYTQQCAVMLN